MGQKENEVILKDLWKDELGYRKNPKNRHDVKLQQKLFAELKALGYKLYWDVQFNSKTFTEKDKAVIPIILKYLDQFENEGLKFQFALSLGVKGFYDATPYLIEEYKKNIPPNYNAMRIDIFSQTIARIQDSRFIETYLEFLQRSVNVVGAGYIIRMLGIMKVESSIPHLIRLLNEETILPSSYYGTILEMSRYDSSLLAIEALGRFRNPQYIAYVEQFLEPEKLSWIKFEESKEKKGLLKDTYKEYKKTTQKTIRRMSN